MSAMLLTRYGKARAMEYDRSALLLARDYLRQSEVHYPADAISELLIRYPEKTSSDYRREESVFETFSEDLDSLFEKYDVNSNEWLSDLKLILSEDMWSYYETHVQETWEGIDSD